MMYGDGLQYSYTRPRAAIQGHLFFITMVTGYYNRVHWWHLHTSLQPNTSMCVGEICQEWNSHIDIWQNFLDTYTHAEFIFNPLWDAHRVYINPETVLRFDPSRIRDGRGASKKSPKK